VSGLDEHGHGGTVGERTVRAAIVRHRAVRVAQGVHGTRARGTAGPATDGRRAGDGTVQTEPVRARVGVPGEPRLPDRARVQTVPVRGRVQGGRAVALSGAGRLVRARTHVQRAKGLREGVPVHQKGYREVSASAVLAGTAVLVGRQTSR